MGASHSLGGEAGKAKLRYQRMIRQRKLALIESIAKEHNEGHKLSVLADTGPYDLDWKVLFEDFLEQHTDTCFWAAPLLRYPSES